MAADDIIKVGNRVRRASWLADGAVTVTAVGRESFLAVATNDREGTYALRVVPGDNWELAPQRFVVELRPPKAGERYVTVDGVIFASVTDAPSYLRRMVIVEGL